jgi:hypothetical protein
MQRLCGLGLKQLRLETAPRQLTTDAQRRARLHELAEARHLLDEELAILHWKLGQDPELCD